MRSVILTILLLVVVRSSAQSDTIFPNTLDSPGGISAWWAWTDYYMDGIGGPWSVGQSVLYMSQPNFEQDGLSYGTIYTEDLVPQGRIAVDSGRVYFRPIVSNAMGRYFTDTLTRLLYDFNLQVGDTAYNWYGDPVVVDSIDTVYLDDRPRPRLNLTYGEQWIEGMGSTYGLMWQFTGSCECGNSVLHNFCGYYLDDDSVAYQACFPFNVGVAQIEKVSLVIRPNPSSGTFMLDHVLPNKPYSLTDTRGIEILSGMTNAESTAINIPNAMPGLYVLDVDGIRTKVIVQ